MAGTVSWPGLPLFMTVAGRPVILLGDGPAAEAKRRLLERAGALVVGEKADARLAIVAVDDDAEAEAAVARLRARGVLVNAVDRPASCDFTIPAIVDRAPVLVAIGTGGASAGLAAALRQRLEALLPSTLGHLARRLFDAREALRHRFPVAEERRRALGAALAPGGPLDPLGDSGRIDAWLAGAEGEPARLVKLTLVSPDPDALTLRQARLLAEADRLYHRADVPAAILDRARADAVRIACAAPPATPGPGLSLDLEIAR
jgi:uroporphyrin-III C-methyltransferase/precorrin-2 dehydrogenase/sirohydrochlorin ferrochelatase